MIFKKGRSCHRENSFFVSKQLMIVLFVREYKEEHGYTSPFVFLGEADYVSHEGNKPMSFVWRLREEMPAKMVVVANKCIV